MSMVDNITALNESQMYYTASQSPYVQGVEIVTIGQLLNSTQVKIRGNISPGVTVDNVATGYQNTNGKFSFFDDTLSPENFGNLRTHDVDVYTPGRVSGPTGKNTYITFLRSGTQYPVGDGSSRSSASLTVKGKLNYFVSHQIEQRDLGQSEPYDNNEPFRESDPISKNPALLLYAEPENIVIPTSLAVAGMRSMYDGVIEAMAIRSVIDGSSIDLPFFTNGIKCSLSVSDEKQRSYIFDDCFDLRQMENGKSTSPFLDYVSTFGTIDQPGSFSDAKENLFPFVDTTSVEQSYNGDVVDNEIRNLFFSGISSSSQQYRTPDLNNFPIYSVAARHGFVFSQNDNFGYDSIAFGGLKR